MHNNKETLNYIKIVFDYLLNAFGSKPYGDDFDVEGGFAFKSNQYSKDGTFVLRVTNINPDGSIKKGNLDKFVNDPELIKNLQSYELKENDILIVMVGGSLGKVGKVSKEILPALLNQNLWKINNSKNINQDYLFYLSLYLNEFKASIKTSSFGHFSRKKYRELDIPNLKIEESEFIALFLNELCIKRSIIDLDILKPIKTNLTKLLIFDKNKLKISSELTHQLNLIKQLRQSFLREAMQGKLIKSTNTKETGQQLLEKVKAEKAQLIAEKKLKKEKELSPINNDEIPFEIPKHWAWCKIGDISTSIVPNRDKPLTFSGDITWVTQSNFSEKSFKLNYNLNSLGFTKEEIVKYNCRVMPKGSVIMSCVGRFDLVCLIEREIVANQQLHCFVPNGDIVPMYLAYAVKLFSKYIEKDAIHTTIKYINKTKCESIPIPLPPLHEQQQIVTKLEELMAFCDGLEQSIKESQAYNEKLLQQVLREALQPKEGV